ncbi:MAG: hypothetical protein HC777_02285 [Hyphomonadaceae bacterium]|nr:hypothetical protein [Hyphomonadaceae bacterium]
MATTTTNINNYYIGKGKVFWTPDGGAERELDAAGLPEVSEWAAKYRCGPRAAPEAETPAAKSD